MLARHHTSLALFARGNEVRIVDRAAAVINLS
jgi:hypothetical protein